MSAPLQIITDIDAQLRIEPATSTGLTVRFQKSMTRMVVEWSESLGSGEWIEISELDAGTEHGEQAVNLSDIAKKRGGFFRIRADALP